MCLHISAQAVWENTRETGIAGQFWGEQRGWQLGAERRFLYLIIYVCVCLCVGSARVCRFMKSPEAGVRAPAAGVTEWSCEQPSTGAGTQTGDLRKCSAHS